jgi:chromosome segregation ATPase
MQSQTDVLKKTQSETRGALEELVRIMTALQADLSFQKDAIQKGVQRQEADREAAKDRLAESQSQIDALKRGLAATGEANAELAQAVIALQDNFERQRQVMQAEFLKLTSEREAVNARLAASQSEDDALKKLLAGTGAGNAELARAVTALQDDFARQTGVTQAEFQKRDAEREAVNAKLAALQSENDALKKLLAGTAANDEGLVQAMTALQKGLTRQAEATQAEFQKLNAEQEAANAKLAASQSENDALKKLLAGTGVSNAELAQVVAVLQNDLARQAQATQAEFQKLNAEQEAASARLAASQSENDALKKLLAGTGVSNAEMAQAVAALQNDLARQAEAIQAEFQKLNAEQEAANAKMAVSQSENDALKKLVADNGAGNAELGRALVSLQNDFARQAEMIQAELQNRDAEGEAGKAALAEMQSQTDALKQLLADRERAVTDALGGGFFTAGADANAAVRQEPFPAAGGDTKPGARVDKDEAVRLHSSARDAYARGDLPEALRLLDIIDAAFPRNKSVLYNRAQCLIGLGRNDEARKLCDYLGTTLNHAPAEDLKRQIRD